MEAHRIGSQSNHINTNISGEKTAWSRAIRSWFLRIGVLSCRHRMKSRGREPLPWRYPPGRRPSDLASIQCCLLPGPSAKPPLRRELGGAGGPAAPRHPRSTLTAERWPGVESSSDFPSSAHPNCVVGSASSEPRISHPSLHPGFSRVFHPCAEVCWIPRPQPKLVLTPPSSVVLRPGPRVAWVLPGSLCSRG